MGKSLSEVTGNSTQSSKALDENLKKMVISHEKNLIAMITAGAAKTSMEDLQSKTNSKKGQVISEVKSGLKSFEEEFKDSAKGVWATAAVDNMNDKEKLFTKI